ncbi:MAG: HIT family protein [Candidatus Aenigmarchaeota archaeon]|nr:HIT family protein [Candidatus Aenigmarchaeota archaeon]
MDCLFCKIIRGEIPSRKVYEDKDSVAFLDINPANPGHTLVMPKKHAENIFDADDEMLGRVIVAAKAISKKIKDSLNADGINVIQNNGRHAGQIVNHIHFHIIPRFANDTVIISYPKIKMEDKDFEEIQKKLTESERKVQKNWEMDLM